MEQIHSLLIQAITGESTAEKKYKDCAFRALAEGYPKIAELFTALSKAEAIHAANHQRALEKNDYKGSLKVPENAPLQGSVRQNLESAIKAEQLENQKMYPSFSRQIRKVYGGSFKAKIALLSIRWASESEAEHAKLLKSALAALAAGSDVEGGDYYLCSVCGNIHFCAQSPDELCKVCGHDISFFSRITVGQ